MSNLWERVGTNWVADRSGRSPEMDARPIGIKLGAAFAILVAILIGIGILCLSRMDQINTHLEDVLGRHWAKLQ